LGLEKVKQHLNIEVNVQIEPSAEGYFKEAEELCRV